MHLGKYCTWSILFQVFLSQLGEWEIAVQSCCNNLLTFQHNTRFLHDKNAIISPKQSVERTCATQSSRRRHRPPQTLRRIRKRPRHKRHTTKLSRGIGCCRGQNESSNLVACSSNKGDINDLADCIRLRLCFCHRLSYHEKSCERFWSLRICGKFCHADVSFWQCNWRSCFWTVVGNCWEKYRVSPFDGAVHDLYHDHSSGSEVTGPIDLQILCGAFRITTTHHLWRIVGGFVE